MLENVKKFAFEHFGSLKGLADAMGIKPQNLNSYIKGEVKIGPKFLYRLKSVGFNDNIDITLPKNQNVILEKKENKAIDGLDIKGAIALSNTPLERLAQLVGVAPAVLSSWQDGTATPTPTQLSTLFNLVVALGLSAQTNRETKEAATQAG